MSPVLPGLLPPQLTPSRLVFVAQSISLLFFTRLVSSALSLSATASLGFFCLLSASFFGLSVITRNQSTWISVAAAYGEAGAWAGGMASVVFFLYVFFFEAREHGATAFLFAVSCAVLLGWLPGLLAGFSASLCFWGLGGWMFAAIEQQKQFPALDNAHRMLSRVGFWLCLQGGIALYAGALCWGIGLWGLGVPCVVAARLSLERRAMWLQEVSLGLIPQWRLTRLSAEARSLVPLSNYSAQDRVLIYQRSANAPYRSVEDGVLVAIY